MLVLGVLAAVYFAWPVYRAFLPLQIENGGAWNAYHADFIRAGLPLYSFDDFITNNYPPLSFYLLDALSAVTGVDVLYVGRVLSSWRPSPRLSGSGRVSAPWAVRSLERRWERCGGLPPRRSGTRFGSGGTIPIWSLSPL